MLLEMDANLSDKVVLSSWDYFILFHRVQPTVIHVSRIIPRDPTSNAVRDNQGVLYSSIAPLWTPLKLVFALLLLALHPHKLKGYAPPGATHLDVPVATPSSSEASSFRKRRRLEVSTIESASSSSASGDPLFGTGRVVSITTLETEVLSLPGPDHWPRNTSPSVRYHLLRWPADAT